jgi:hypothetical protein
VSINVFFSYSRQDEALREKLAEHLIALERQGIITSWSDRKIEAGAEWAAEIDTCLNNADIILLLVSASFLNSDYCWGVELEKAMARHEAGEACVIPVILRPVIWKGTPFGKLQVLPKDAKPVTQWNDQDAALMSVAEGIETAVERLLLTRQKPAQTAKQQGSLILNKKYMEEQHPSLHYRINDWRKFIPWGWLTGIFLFYGSASCILSLSNAPSLTWTLAWFGALALALAAAGIWSWFFVGLWALSGLLIWTSVWSLALALALAELWGLAPVGCLALVVAMSLANEKLSCYFSRLHTFLILAGTSLTGLLVGWLAVLIFWISVR